MDDAKDLQELMDLWINSSVKVTIAGFFRQNPGVIDTLAGFSRRLSIPQEVLRTDLADHIRLGVIRERGSEDKAVYMLDRARRREIEERIVRRAQAVAP